MERTTITVRDDGSLRASGPVDVVDATGARWPLEEGKPVFLCRCGHSASKPFCDGSHNRESFRSAPRAEGEPGA